MGTLQQIHNWSLSHHPRWFVVLRVALGLLLFIKGFSFMFNATALTQFMENNPILTGAQWWLLIVITWAHMLGGVLIIIGLLTRYAVLLQIPILLGAVFFLTTKNSVLGGPSELVFSILVLLLLVFFLIEGGGPISLDNYFRRIPKE